MPIGTKPKTYVCIEAFSATLKDGDHWYKVGQRVSADSELFDGESGKNRQRRLFTPEETE